MAKITREGAILHIGDTHRIEAGPRLLTGKATAELLSDDATADHYHAPRPATEAEIASPNVDTVDGQYFAKDALGQPIELGGEMAYLDWLAFRAGTDQVFYLYAWQTIPATGEADARDAWVEAGVFDTEEAALSAALGD
jgi:hypothetical protein